MTGRYGITSAVSLLLLAAAINIDASSAFSPSLSTFVPHVDGSTRPNRSSRPYSALKLSSSSSTDEPRELQLRAMTFQNLDRSTEPQLLSDFLMELGACSVSITDSDRDTDLERPIFNEPQDGDDYDSFAAVICGDAAVGKNVWRRCDVTSHFPASFDLVHVADQVRYTFGTAKTPRYTVDDVEDRDWVVHVQSSWKPAVVDGFVLRFPWHGDGDVEEAVGRSAAEDGGSGVVAEYTQLQLEGGIAFGTGEHPTTRLCLGWIRDTVRRHPTSLFLDYGSGSGVLGMAACAVAASDPALPPVRSVGIDIDPDAIRIADYNAGVNGVDMKSYLPRGLGEDDESASVIMKALHRTDTDVLPEEMDGAEYDACAANILAGPLRSLVGTIAGMVRSGGRIGLSGILSYQAEDVVQTYSEYFDDVVVKQEQSGWVLITGTRK